MAEEEAQPCHNTVPGDETEFFAVIGRRDAPEPSPEFWDAYWDRMFRPAERRDALGTTSQLADDLRCLVAGLDQKTAVETAKALRALGWAKGER